jgi:hypothetical protein
MFNFIAGCVLGFCVATMGFAGLAAKLDQGIETIKSTSVTVEKK